MSLRVQVILEERDALKFRSQAIKESKSLVPGWGMPGKKCWKSGRRPSG